MICVFVLLLADVASAARVRPRTGPCLRSPEGRDHAPEIRWPHRDHGPGADIELALAHRLLADVESRLSLASEYSLRVKSALSPARVPFSRSSRWAVWELRPR
jgi:hypothetical protein